MTTLRKELKAAGFNWRSGQLVYQPVTEDAYAPGWANEKQRLRPVFIDKKHAILDVEFSGGFGKPEMPRFFGRDADAVYFPTQYDGSTSVTRIETDVVAYIAKGAETPYPGGG